MSNEIKRNDPCPCGSGKKYKKCCGMPGMAKHKTEVITNGTTAPLLHRITSAGSYFQEKENKTLKSLNLQVGPLNEKKSQKDEKKD